VRDANLDQRHLGDNCWFYSLSVCARARSDEKHTLAPMRLTASGFKRSAGRKLGAPAVWPPRKFTAVSCDGNVYSCLSECGKAAINARVVIDVCAANFAKILSKSPSLFPTPQPLLLHHAQSAVNMCVCVLIFLAGKIIQLFTDKWKEKNRFCDQHFFTS
jgi:hypothetical protein